MEASTVPTAASRPMKSSEKAVEKHGVPVIENPITGRPNNPTGASMSAMLLAAGAYGSNGTAKRTILRVPSKEAQTPNRRGRLPRIPSNEDSAPSSDSGPGRSLSPITPSRQDGYKHSPLKREGLDTSGASLSSRTTEDTNDGSPVKFGVPSAPLKSPVVTHNSVSTYGAAAGGGVGGGGRDRAADSDAATAVSLDKTIRRIVALESSRLSLSEQLATHHRRFLELEVKRDKYTRQMEEASAELTARRNSLAQSFVTLSGIQSRLDHITREHDACEAEIGRVREQLSTLAELVREVSLEVNDRKAELAEKQALIAEIQDQCKDVVEKRMREEEAIASFAAEAERLRDEAMSLESTVQSREEGLDNLRAVNEALKAQLMSLGGSIGLEGGLGVEAVTRERRTLPVISPLPVGKSVRVADEDSKFENEAESPLVSSRSYQRDTSIEWQQGDQIGEGAYSKVFIGMNKFTGELMAVKELRGFAFDDSGKPIDSERLRKLEEEIRVMHKLAHPNIVQYLGTSRKNGHFHILLEFVPGGSISSLLKRFGAFSEDIVRKYSRDIVKGLSYLHKHGVIHRDIKGANLLVIQSGEVKLADFGCSTWFDGNRSVPVLSERSIGSEESTVPEGGGKERLIGSIPWMAPEVMRQEKSGRRSDIWSLGCTVVEMLSGYRPWAQVSHPLSLLYHVATTSSPPDIPSATTAITRDFLAKCFYADPTERWTADQLLAHPFIRE